jgi:hypothetical protein
MPVTWTTITPSGPSWAPLPGDRDDWQDPRLTELLTESGLYLRCENDDFLCIEAVILPTSPWVPL